MAQPLRSELDSIDELDLKDILKDTTKTIYIEKNGHIQDN